MGVGKEDERFVPPPEVHYNLGEKRRGREALKEQTQTQGKIQVVVKCTREQADMLWNWRGRKYFPRRRLSRH